ncbi:MAG: RNA-binding protein [Candidatus Nanoarchaeia archaeon]|nr:RNA-binding protein [Candidatus Nanoarchaeia archaeon]
MENIKDNSVFISGKPFMKYVTAGVLKLNKGDIIIKARGKWITRAVDVAEVIRNSFVKEAKISGIKIGSQEVSDEKRKTRISTIELTMAKE